MTDIKTVLPEPRDESVQDTAKAWQAKGWNDCRRAIEAAVLAASAPAQEPIYWEYRHLDTCNEPQKWGEWERVDKSKGTLADLRQYIASGYKYELRALYAAPVDAQDAVDAKRYRFLRAGHSGCYRNIMIHAGDALDKSIDAALLASQSPENQDAVKE